ncbi:Helix-turn-helix domain-containing protein [Puniceibacterium sediminis]|uniref:Helix-turn-helix domain-containing protein n=1 Tax=Puniceibacterium sediminis TaxID=1608407 RepID=A0A238ZYT8_9RHOB|nr:helix-turn-helix domain-containing protein [Puniceibacterium sediminis]SNR88557.1 Helix-turn-helix domain-containing protein [Puniceibacterium sediminis]
MAHTELGLRERRMIEDMLNAKMSVDEIAAEIGRHRSTVYREIKRNRFIDDELPDLNGYYGMTAQGTAVNRRARRRKLVRFVDLRNDLPSAGPSSITRVRCFQTGGVVGRFGQARRARSREIAQASGALRAASGSRAMSVA